MAGSRRKRGPDRSAAIRFTLFAIVTISLTVFMAFAIVGTNFGSSYTLVASFDNVNGLRSGDLVKVAGAPVGRVDSVTVKLGKAVVRVSVDKSIHMPVDSEAVIRWRNLIGRREVYLQAGQSSEMLRDGATVTRTQSTVDLGSVINSLGPLTGSLDPDEINKILQSFAVALAGNEGNINQITTNLNLLITTFGNRSATIDQMIKDYKTVTDTVGQRDLEIAQTVQNLTTLTEAFSTNRATLSNALIQLRRFTTNLDTVTGGNVQQIGAIIVGTKKLLEIAHQHQVVLGSIINGLPTALQALLSANSGGHFARTSLVCLNFKLTPVCPFPEVLPAPPAAGGKQTSSTPQLSAADQAAFGKLATLLLVGAVQKGSQ